MRTGRVCRLRVAHGFRKSITVLLFGVAALFFFTGAEVTRLNIGGWTVSAIVSVAVAVLLLGWFALELFGQTLLAFLKERFLGKFAAVYLLVLGYWIYVALSSIRDFHLEAAQSVAVTTIFCLGVLFFSETFNAGNAGLIHKVFGFGALFSAAIFLANQALGFLIDAFNPGWLDPAAFSMVLLLGLSVALARTGVSPIWWSGVGLVFFALVLSSARMPTFSAWLIISVFPLLLAKPVGFRVLAALLAWALSGLVIVASYLFYGPNNRRMTEYFPEIFLSLPGSEIGVGVSSSGRFWAWREFLGMPSTVWDWIFGLGAGASANFGRANINFFPQTLNEYIRNLVDFGAVGLALFLGLNMYLLVLFYANRSNLFARGAFLALVGSLMLAVTDGQFIYPFVVTPLSALLGLGLFGSGPGTTVGPGLVQTRTPRDR